MIPWLTFSSRMVIIAVVNVRRRRVTGHHEGGEAVEWEQGTEEGENGGDLCGI